MYAEVLLIRIKPNKKKKQKKKVEPAALLFAALAPVESASIGCSPAAEHTPMEETITCFKGMANSLFFYRCCKEMRRNIPFSSVYFSLLPLDFEQAYEGSMDRRKKRIMHMSNIRR